MSLFSGPVLAVFAFILWGITPLFYQLLPNANVPELLAQRLFWSVPLLLLLRLLFKHRTTWRDVWHDKRSLLFCLVGGGIMSVSWSSFIYALTHNQVLDASLGYFITPLFSIALGVILLRDRLSRFQRIAVALAICGLAYQIVLADNIPILALLMGSAFAFYGLTRKFIHYDIMTALTLETLWMIPLALAITLWLHLNGQSSLTTTTTHLLYALSAPITFAPLLLFAVAIKRTSLTVVGLAQYVEPSLQFLLAIVYFGEPLQSAKLISFSLIWLGLLCCVYELFHHHWRFRHLAIDK